MKALKPSSKHRYKQQQNATSPPLLMKDSNEILDGWRHESITNVLSQKPIHLNIITSRDQKTITRPITRAPKMSKEIFYTDHETSGILINHLKQQALRLDLDPEFEIPKKESRRVTQPPSKSIQSSNKQHLENLFRLTKNGIITQSFSQKKQRALKKRSLKKMTLNPNFNKQRQKQGSVKRVRDTLMKDWDDAKKCISAISSTKSSHRTYLNYSERIKNCTLYRNRVMKVVFDEPVHPPPRLSVCSIPQTSKLELINSILKERFPEIF